MEHKNYYDHKTNSHLGINQEHTEHPVFPIDDELFIHEAFETNAAEGCTLLFKKYFSALCNHAVRYVYSKSIAEDIVSEIFCRFWEKETYRTVRSFRCYLFCAARNKALTYVRLHFKNERDVEKENLMDDDWSRTPESFTAMEELQHCLKELVQKMPPQRRTVFILSRFEEKTYAEIANEMHLSVKTVESYMGIALDFIRTGLKDYAGVSKKKCNSNHN